MSTVYVIQSNDSFLINSEITKIINKFKDNPEITKYSMDETLIDNVVEDLDTFNFLTSRKIIIASNAYFLTSEKDTYKLEHNLEKLTKYIENPSPDNILVFTCSKMDGKKNIVKLLNKKANIIEGEVNIYKVLNSRVDDYKIDEKTKNYLIEYCNNDYYKVINELEKLKLFKYDEKEININDIDNYVSKSIDDNIFKLVDAIISKDKKTSFEIYNDLILKNEEPLKILILVANKFRLLYQVKKLSQTVHSNDEIASIIGSHPYPVKLARTAINKYKEEDIIKILYQLSKIDVDIKSGNTYQNIAFEMLIMSL